MYTKPRPIPSMHASNFYDDSSDEEDALEDCSISPKQLTDADAAKNALASFRFFDPSPSLPTSSAVRRPAVTTTKKVLPRLHLNSTTKGPPKPQPTNTVPAVAATVPITSNSKSQSVEEMVNQMSPACEEDLQEYVQKLLQGAISDDGIQEMDLYQECLSKKPANSSHILAPGARMQYRDRRGSYKNNNRLSIMSTASDASAVPSLVFSDVGLQTRRPSMLSTTITHSSNLRSPNRNSVASIVSIQSVESSMSWFMEDASPPQSPVESVPAKQPISFSRGVGMGMSLFDDGDDDDEEEEVEFEEAPGQENQSMQSPESPLFFFIPEPSQNQETTRKRQNPRLTIKTNATTSPTFIPPPLTHSPMTAAQSPACATPPRRTRRRTASSECIVLDALEKMNAVMSEFAQEDINRKSVVGLDLPGNQVSIEAYGELWW
ncbi:hypothetical protein BDZ91DRAFT_758354 [Kalaharituber pfeilii]|nr:hypothetical protein BDZ91DRAFT_758354 [Kalaharituber pfeilii]